MRHRGVVWPIIAVLMGFAHSAHWTDLQCTLGVWLLWLVIKEVKS